MSAYKTEEKIQKRSVGYTYLFFWAHMSQYENIHFCTSGCTGALKVTLPPHKCTLLIGVLKSTLSQPQVVRIYEYMEVATAHVSPVQC